MLRLETITAGYQRCPVIYEINHTFEAGTITAVIGPNGSGKSTLLKAMVGLINLYDGRIYLNNMPKEDIGNKEFSRHVSYLSQGHIGGAITVSRLVLHGRFPHLTYPRRYSSRDYEYCHEAMKQMGILPLKDKRIEELSGGQRQKVYLAMALAGAMEVYLFDEPTTYLDVKYQLEVFETMQQLREQGKTIITVVHDMNHAMQMADQVMVLNLGRNVFSGRPAEIMEHKIIDDVFQVSTKVFMDEKGRKHLLFERKNA